MNITVASLKVYLCNVQQKMLLGYQVQTVLHTNKILHVCQVRKTIQYAV